MISDDELELTRFIEIEKRILETVNNALSDYKVKQERLEKSINEAGKRLKKIQNARRNTTRLSGGHHATDKID